jgi:hypothetical protein
MGCKTVTIKEGHHSTRRLFKFGIGRNFDMGRLVIFSKECDYSLPYPDYLDINKLFGFSDGFNHHKNSIRVGWRNNRVQQQIDLFHYQYIDGKRKTEFLCSVPYETPVSIYISAKKKYHITKVIGRDLHIEKLSGRKKRHWFHYFLYLYFGGNLVAPKDMDVSICKL